MKLKRTTRDASIFNLPVYKASAREVSAEANGVCGCAEKSKYEKRARCHGSRSERENFAEFGSGECASRETFRRHRSQKENRLTGRKYTDIYEGRDIGANLWEIIIYRATPRSRTKLIQPHDERKEYFDWAHIPAREEAFCFKWIFSSYSLLLIFTLRYVSRNRYSNVCPYFITVQRLLLFRGCPIFRTHWNRNRTQCQKNIRINFLSLIL